MYKRHSKTCKVHAAQLNPTMTKFWMECDCAIWITGMTRAGKIVDRQSTGFVDLKGAEGLRDSLNRMDSGETLEKGLGISDAIRVYIPSRAHEVKPATAKTMESLLFRFEKFARNHKADLMKEITVDLVETFRVEGLPGLKDTTKANLMAHLVCFLRHAFRRDWITIHLAEKVNHHHFHIDQKDPYTDDEVAQILSTAERQEPSRGAYGEHPQTFRLLMELMLETGMRVGDAVVYNPKGAVMGQHMWEYAFEPQKQKRIARKRRIEVFISDDLQQRILQTPWLSPKLPFQPVNLNRGAAKAVYEQMQEIGKICEVEDCRPHRLRDTFAVRTLLAGISLDDVSRLLGHSSVTMTERYYAKWCTTRKTRLAGLFAVARKNSQKETLRDGETIPTPAPYRM